MKNLEVRYLERLSELYPTIAAASDGGHQPGGDFKPAEGNGAFSDGYPWRV